MAKAPHDPAGTTRRHAGTPDSVFVPVGRGRALARSSVWLAPALVLGLFSWHLLADMRLGESGGTRTIVEGAILAALVPFGLLGIAMLALGLRWLLLAVWPGRVGVTADAHALRLALGPFGNRTYDAHRLDIRYFFELSADMEEGGFEALLPETEQIKNFLPRLIHPNAKRPLNRAILKFAGMPESAVAQMMRPVFAHWRKAPPRAGGES